MELEEAKKILLNCYAMRTKHELDDENKALKQAIEVVLKELDKKDDVIDEMAKYIGDQEECLYNFEKCENTEDEYKCYKCAKQYFYKKVEDSYE